MSEAPAPACTACGGSGLGETVYTGQGTYRAQCTACNGTGRQT
ncbi:hypothetical protein [Streptomyces ramulosus]